VRKRCFALRSSQSHVFGFKIKVSVNVKRAQLHFALDLTCETSHLFATNYIWYKSLSCTRVNYKTRLFTFFVSFIVFRLLFHAFRKPSAQQALCTASPLRSKPSAQQALCAASPLRSIVSLPFQADALFFCVVWMNFICHFYTVTLTMILV